MMVKSVEIGACSEIKGVSVRCPPKYDDSRGWLVELFRNDQLVEKNFPQMAYVSMTLPGVTRGPHEHREQWDYFVFIGVGSFELHLWERRQTEAGTDYLYHEKHVFGEKAVYSVIVPPGIIHAYRNMSENIGLVFNAPNELYAGPGKCYPVDEIRHEENACGIFRLD